jgi:hypothetical protein
MFPVSKSFKSCSQGQEPSKEGQIGFWTLSLFHSIPFSQFALAESGAFYGHIYPFYLQNLR